MGAPKELQCICRSKPGTPEPVCTARLLWKYRTQPKLSSIRFTIGIAPNQPCFRNQVCVLDSLNLTPRPGSNTLVHSSIKVAANTKIKYTVWNGILGKLQHRVWRTALIFQAGQEEPKSLAVTCWTSHCKCLSHRWVAGKHDWHGLPASCYRATEWLRLLHSVHQKKPQTRKKHYKYLPMSVNSLAA